ncbi:MAG: radical SAM protein [Pontiellaceae bacterium]|jgi:MoaA/NifB/PqqE/SkfB family radical SAM enzyme|nr:radical SAM protein [Pontiellaceae bacterium]
MNSKLETFPTRNSPRIIAWEITRRCGLKCRHCRGAARDCDYDGEFSTDECFKTVEALAAFSKPMIILTGGEPLMRADIFDVARYATERGCRVVLATCGHLLTAGIAQRLKASGVMAVSVSLDAATAEAHNAFRGVEAAYEKTLAGIDLLKQAGLPFQINTTVSKLNVDELPQILEKAVELGASTMDFFFFVPTGRGSEIAGFALDPAERDRALHWIAAQARTSTIRIKTTCAPQYKRFLDEECQRSESLKSEGLKSKVGMDVVSCNSELETLNSELETSPTQNSLFRGCMGGRGFVFISHTGILQPCGFLDLPCGDLRAANFDFGQLYRNAGVFKNMRTLNPFAGCPARAFAQTGDYLSGEPT